MRNYLKKYREEMNMTQQNVAQRMGISQQYYAGIEKGTRQKEMTLATAENLCEIFGVTIEEIRTEEKRGRTDEHTG